MLWIYRESDAMWVSYVIIFETIFNDVDVVSLYSLLGL